MNISMKTWLDEMLNDKQVRFAPILYYPGLSLVDWNAKETLQEGGAEKMALTMKALVERFPDMAFVMTGLDTSADAESFGCQVMYAEDRAPHTVSVVAHTQEDVDGLELPDVYGGRFATQYEAVRRAKELIQDRPVFGNMTAPFTTASMLMPLAEAMTNVVKNPDLMHALIEKCTQHAINRAKAYKEAGADGIMLNDATGGVIPPKMNAAYSAAYIKRVVDAVQDDHFIVMMHNCGNIARSLKHIYGTGCRLYSFGNNLDMTKALESLPADAMVLGNVDPMKMVSENPEEITTLCKEVLEKAEPYGHFILSTGCDCPPDVKLENADAMLQALKN
ncbi:MAG: uroporphyrinogen decarboxylase family protein [Lachnospiraceae bacterium]|nr:uroporphyrinogen decarboxylase family protein [Candidatus Equihabitans merdae]